MSVNWPYRGLTIAAVVGMSLAASAQVPIGPIGGAFLSSGGGTVTGAITAPAFIPNGSTVPVNGLYLPAANTVGLATNTIKALDINTSNTVSVYTTGGTSTVQLVPSANGSTGGVYLNNSGMQMTASTGNGLRLNGNSILTAPGAAVWRLGDTDLATPVAQTLQTQSVVAGTNNGAGALWTLQDSAGTGSGISGGYAFQVAAASGSGTTQNAYSSALTIAGGTGLVALPKISSDATHTDATVCEDTTSHALYAGSGTAGICLGTSSLRFKHDVSPLTADLGDALLKLEPISYRYNKGYGGGDDRLLYGFAAEQVATVLPQLVSRDTEGRPNSVDWAGIVPLNTLEIKRIADRLDRVERQLADQASEVTRWKAACRATPGCDQR